MVPGLAGYSSAFTGWSCSFNGLFISTFLPHPIFTRENFEDLQRSKYGLTTKPLNHSSILMVHNIICTGLICSSLLWLCDYSLVLSGVFPTWKMEIAYR